MLSRLTLALEPILSGSQAIRSVAMGELDRLSFEGSLSGEDHADRTPG